MRAHEVSCQNLEALRSITSGYRRSWALQRSLPDDVCRPQNEWIEFYLLLSFSIGKRVSSLQPQ